jgi:hypothetical protein
VSLGIAPGVPVALFAAHGGGRAAYKSGAAWPEYFTRIASAALDGSMTALPAGSDPLRRWAAWRDAGGRLNLAELTLRTADARASLSGSATLDAAMRPAGDGTLVLQNAPAAIDAGVAAGLLPRSLATPARLLATVMARPVPDTATIQSLKKQKLRLKEEIAGV